jgi:hypothetical protein
MKNFLQKIVEMLAIYYYGTISFLTYRKDKLKEKILLILSKIISALTMRPRNAYMVYGTIVVSMLMLLADPDLNFISYLPFGAEQLVLLTIIGKSILYAILLHMTRKGFLDYDSADLSKLFDTAKETPLSSSIAIVGVGIIMIAFAIVISNVA